MRDVGLGDKVYSPDLETFELEGPTGLYGTIASLVVGPIRVVTRVMHNIVILPANLLRAYSEGLLLVSGILLTLGVIDIVIFGKWPLFVSQIPMVAAGALIKSRASAVVISAERKSKVEFDDSQIESLCDSVYSELNKALKEE